MVGKTGADVVIAGTGIVGCLIAEQMLDAGLSVLMLEAGPRIDRGRIIVNYRNMPPARHSQGNGQIDLLRTPLRTPGANPTSGLAYRQSKHRYHSSQVGHHQGESRIMDPNPDDTVYPDTKIALVLDTLAAEGVPKEDALRPLRLTASTYFA
ncbi:choline dehydrogenase-like flavoprotein [Nitrobacteraceae bacterium AZCC 2161]